GGDGKVTTRFATRSEDYANAVAIQSDGEIVLAGATSVPTTSPDRLALARSNLNGRLNRSFGGDGKVTTRFATRSDDYANAVAIQPDGRIVAAGTSYGLRHGRFALARYLAA